jgi:hypothetical protein
MRSAALSICAGIEGDESAAREPVRLVALQPLGLGVPVPTSPKSRWNDQAAAADVECEEPASSARCHEHFFVTRASVRKGERVAECRAERLRAGEPNSGGIALETSQPHTRALRVEVENRVESHDVEQRALWRVSESAETARRRVRLSPSVRSSS